ncbi:hypothetical protein FH972_015118 [Carpinus fangiana]|uniref:Uncharacterized protein n=1 Tax=Carpinus fangiana TaxID=176857 RepID=A0A5N6RFE0_9ROSI|nr:hypothetical protein FH972_015118 [Carpinus fangiana]
MEHVQSPKHEKRDRNLARDLILREVDNFEVVEGGVGGGKVTGEVVVVEEEGFEIEEAGEVGDLSKEGVALEAEHPKLVELVEDIVIQNSDLLPPSITSTPKTKQGAKESFSRLFPFSFIPDLNAVKATAGNITLGGTGDPVKSKGSSTLPSTAFKGGERSSALGNHRMETMEWASFLAKLTNIYSISFA